MRTNILLLSAISLLISFADLAFGQNDTINQVDKLNRKQGYWTKSYPNGKKAYEGRFKDDKPIGEFNRYREDGTLKVTLNYNTTGNYSKATFFTSEGKKIAEGYYLGKEKDSLWQYFDSNLNLSYEERYSKGLKNGRFKQFYNNGKTLETIPYSNGQIDGVMVQFHPNGLNKSIITFKSGTQHGPIKLYYSDGTLRIEGNYSNGLKDGEWKFYSAEGKLSETVMFKKGTPENYSQLIERENKELELMLKNAGKIQEPTVESFLESMGTRLY